MVSLNGIMDRTSFFRLFSRALGLPCTYTFKESQMRNRVEDMLKRTRLAVVIDEAHYALPQGKRITAAPQLIDWIATALCNNGVPVVLVTTPQFMQFLPHVERQTGWNSEQFRGRMRRPIKLPECPSEDDLRLVARHLLPGASKTTVAGLVGYALTTKRYMPALVDTIDDARRIATQEGRELVEFEDVERAIREFRVPSESAMEVGIATGASNKTPARRGRKAAIREPANDDFNRSAEVMQPVSNEPPRAVTIQGGFGGRIDTAIADHMPRIEGKLSEA